MADAPITVASNRLPFSFHRTAGGLERRQSPGGLVTALEPVLRSRGGTWVGWPGIVPGEGETIETHVDRYDIAPVLLSETEVTRYYHGFSNRTLWPLFHSMTDRAQFEHRDYATYEEVNTRFADVVLEAASPSEEGLVWIHDYQLMLAPRRVRERNSNTHLAFFLHIPFPPFDIFRLLPWDREILRSMLACDLIGFHVRGYVQNFFDCVERSLGARVDRRAGLVEYGDRTTRVGSFPIGVDFRAFEELANAAPGRSRNNGEQTVLGVDRLDYTKGIPQRIRAFERLLELYPEHREKVVLLQLAVPSRSQVNEYKELKSEIDELVGSVNGRFATAGWSPIRYLYRSLSRERLAALYRDADVALVTPLRDGMNLVAKEYVACQVRDPGVLVLSRLAGAADTMREALLVNPNDIDGTAEAVHRALTMEEGERASRAVALRRRERRDDLEAWTTRFLEQAAAERASILPMTDDDFDDWLGEFLQKRSRLALFLDYDGTLTPLCEHPDEARLSKPMRTALQSCSRRPDTDVAIVSGRSLEGIRKIVGESVLTYAGNHGLEIEGMHLEPFIHEDLIHYQERADTLAEQLDAIANDGAWTERKGPTLTFHYRAVPEHGRAGLVAEAREVITRAGYQPRDAHCAVEARPPIGWDKGRAVLHVLRSRYGPSWSDSVRVIYVGDDQTDEDAFRFLSGLAATFRVGSPDTSTAALRRLPDTDAVQALLEWIGRRPEATA
ncbi:MAG: bifunctional alpha,alpha-trehalose-phosphate synthase (UDP-forming)/trehalose-phosphatase [Myxococcota bacterium]